ncbi:MAG: hypothetical protein ACYCVG_12355 [Leptospirillum sp.]
MKNLFFQRNENDLAAPPPGIDRILELERRIARGVRLFWALVAADILGMCLIFWYVPSRTLVVGLTKEGEMVRLPEVPMVPDDRSEAVIAAFSRGFLNNLAAYDAFEEPYRLKKAFTKMTPELRQSLGAELSKNHFMESITGSRLRSTLDVREVRSKKVAPGVFSVRAFCVRHVRSYDDRQFLRDDLLKTRMVVKAGSPTPENPYGLWVSSYAEESLDKPSGGGVP